MMHIDEQLLWGVRQSAEAETLITSAERIDEYVRLPREEDEGGPNRLIKTPTDWPNRGVIEFRNYSLRYRSGLEPALKNINLTVGSDDKVGIIGRTGTFEVETNWKVCDTGLGGVGVA